jgi:N-acetylated-alpha-linked acidic dipeptidase
MDAPYSLGPNLRNPGWRIRLDVSTVNERRTTFNTIGILKGSVEEGIKILKQLSLYCENEFPFMFSN